MLDLSDRAARHRSGEKREQASHLPACRIVGSCSGPAVEQELRGGAAAAGEVGRRQEGRFEIG